MLLKTRITAILAGGALAVALVLPAMAALSYSFFGEAEVVATGNPGNAAELTSITGTGDGYGGVEVTGFPTDPATITELSFDYNANQTGASGGSPRMTITFSDGGWADLRPLALVADTWVTIDGMAPAAWDSNGGTCGFSYATDWAGVVACHAGASITEIIVVNDSGWLYPETGLVVLVDNITINEDVITFDDEVSNVPATMDDCKQGGWQELEREDGTAFKNQGDCVSFTNNGK